MLPPSYSLIPGNYPWFALTLVNSVQFHPPVSAPFLVLGTLNPRVSAPFLSRVRRNSQSSSVGNIFYSCRNSQSSSVSTLSCSSRNSQSSSVSTLSCSWGKELSIIQCQHPFLILYRNSELPHRQGGCLAFWRLQNRFPAEEALIYTMHEAVRGTAHEGGGEISQLDLPCLTPL